MLKRIIIDYSDFEHLDEEVMERNSLVFHPAHERDAIFFNKNRQPTFFADNEKRMIVGVAIEADKPIYRAPNDWVNYEHEVVFTKETIEYIRNSFHKSNSLKNINFNHEGEDVEGLTLVQSYIVGGDNNPNLPKILEGKNINPGSWILGYYCEDEKLWNKIKAKKYRGFSVEVYPYLNLYKNFSKHQKSRKMSKRRKSIFNFFKEKFESATITDLDGVTYNYSDEEIIVGTTILYTLNEEGEEVPATNLETVAVYNGEEVAITTNEEGVVTAMADVEEESEVAEEILEEFAKVVRNQLQQRDAEINRLRLDFNAQIAELKKEINKANATAKFSKRKRNGATNARNNSGNSILDLLND